MNSKHYDKWDARYLALCAHISEWSKDPSTKVGSVIVDQKKRIVSMGFNGFPRGVEDTEDRYNNRETKLNMVLHAEENAIIFAKASVEDCTIYTWPLPPCSKCAAKIIQSGIKKVVSPNISLDSKWTDSINLGILMFAEANVDTILIGDGYDHSR